MVGEERTFSPLTQSLGFPRSPAITLGQGLSEGAPGMEAASEGMLLITLTDQAQAAALLVFFSA